MATTKSHLAAVDVQALDVAIMGHTLARPANLSKMLWLMPRSNRVVPYLDYIVVAGA